MSYNNVANKVANDIQVNRNQIEVRATWLALIYDEMLRAGIENTEEILRKAITRYGTIKGEKIKNACADPQDMRQFADKTPSKTGQATFNMDPVSSDYDGVYLSFKYCPLCEAWDKLGLDEQTRATLCDIAMDGDRGIAKAMGFELDIADTIADGAATCKLHYHKNK